MSFESPCLAACLADGAATRLPAGACWIALAPDAMMSARIAAGQLLLVGITGRVAAQHLAPTSPAAGSATRSSGPAPFTSSFGPTPELLFPDPLTGAPPQPQDLWRLCYGRLGLPPLTGQEGGQGVGGGDGGNAAPPGAFLLPARVWPAAKLPRSSALLSPALRESAGQPPAGTVVLLYRPAAAASAATRSPAPERAGHRTPDVGTSADAALAVAVQAQAGGDSAASGGGVVVLRLCAEALLQTRVSSPDSGGGADGGGSGSGRSSDPSAAAVAASPLPAETPPPAAGPKTARVGGAVTTPGRGAAAASPARGAAVSAGTSADTGGGALPGPAPGPLQRWPLETLQRAAEAADDVTRSALAAVARRHLAGRHLMVGAPVVLPVLGSSVVLRVVAAAAAAAGMAEAWQSYGNKDSAIVEVGRGTQVVVLYPREPLPEPFTMAAEAAEAEAVEPGKMGVGALAMAGSPAAVARAVAAAREAAAVAVAESAAEAAAEAAERALRAGLASGGVDFTQLGGVGDHLRALRELVGLPLRAPQLFAHYGIRPPRGVLLYGPPGSGKTVLARAAAADAGATVFLINGPDVVSEYYGESESSLRGIFAAATALAPSVVLIDEVDALAPARGGAGASAHSSGTGSGSDVASRLVTAMLTLLDGADEQQTCTTANTTSPYNAVGGDEATDGATAAAQTDDRPSGSTPSAPSHPAASGSDRGGCLGQGQGQGPGGGRRQGLDAGWGSGGTGGYRPVVVVAATNRPDALDTALRRPGRLEREIEVGVPSAAARLEILQARLRSVRHRLSHSEVAALAAAAHGFVSADLAALVDEAAFCALRRLVAAKGRLGRGRRGLLGQEGQGREEAVEVMGQGQQRAEQQQRQWQQEGAEVEAVAGAGCSSGVAGEAEPKAEPVVTLEDFRTAETRVRPSALREVAVEVPTVRWADIGGMEAVKQALREAVEWPHRAQRAMARLGAQPPRGVLLYGPPGCSKTLLARAVASEAGLNFLAVKGGELVSKYVGESEKAIASLFARARATAPSIIFFDEIDGLVGARGGPESGGGAAGVSERVLSQLLTEMDGLTGRGGVTVLAATNRPDCLDSALLRPGRFDRLIYVPLPDKDARVEILRVQLRRCPVAADVDEQLLAVRTAGYSGADLTAVVREAGLAALEEDLGAQQVAQRHFDSALAAVQPSVPPSAEVMGMYLRMQRSAAG